MRIVILALVSTMMVAAVPPLSQRYNRLYEIRTGSYEEKSKPKESKRKCRAPRKHHSNQCPTKKQHKATQSIDKLR